MSPADVNQALAPLVERLLAAAAGDPALREELRTAARQVLAALADPATVEPAPDGAAPAAAAAGTVAAGDPIAPPAAPPPPTGPGAIAAGPARPAAAGVAPPAMTGPRVVSVADVGDDAAGRAAGAGVPTVPDADLPAIEARCRMKADGCRWAATRRQRLAAGADFRVEVEPLDREIVERARKLPDCFLWMNHPTGPSPDDPAVLETAAACFDVTADALAACRAALADPDVTDEHLEQALALLAEAQSALREAVGQTGYGQDKDQLRTYNWLRGMCWSRQVYLPRHMRADDPASPANWPDLAARVQALDARAQARRRRAGQLRSGLNRIRYHLKPILSPPAKADGSGDDDGHRHDWQVVMDTVDALVADGLPPSSVDLRELLLPAIDRVPDVDPPAGFELVLREVDRFLAERPAPDTEPPPTAEQTASVRKVAGLLAGRVVVMIGGVPRPHARRALVDAFGLAELDWVGTREHESIAPFESHVARPEVAVVLLAIRWSSHSFEGVKAFCERHGKPLVRLPAGYNPNRVAEEILGQVGGRLGIARPGGPIV